jgi:hypothetical protein
MVWYPSAPERQPPPDHESRFRPTIAERKILQIGPYLDTRRLNALDRPALSEGIVQFLFRHPAWLSGVAIRHFFEGIIQSFLAALAVQQPALP